MLSGQLGLHVRSWRKSNAACVLHASLVGLICSNNCRCQVKAQSLMRGSDARALWCGVVGGSNALQVQATHLTQQGLSFGLPASACSLVPESRTPPTILCSQASMLHCQSLVDLGHKWARTAAAEGAVGCRDRVQGVAMQQFSRVACGLGLVACGGAGARGGGQPAGVL
jgi:hypothetical protein